MENNSDQILSDEITGKATSGSSDSKFRLPLIAKLGLVFILVGLATLGYFRTSWHQSEEAERAGLVEIDKEELAKRALVQDFDIKDLSGKTHKISDFRGKVVILSFWASWCTPCLVEMPTIAALYSRLKDKGLVIIPINEDDEPEAKTAAQEFWKKNAFEFPTYVDFSKKIAEQFKVEALPSNFVIDRTGHLVFSGFGENDWSSSQSVEAIETVLNESVVDRTDK